MPGEGFTNKNLLRHNAKWAFKHGEYTWNWESQAALEIFAIQNAHQLWSLKKASRSFQQGRGPSRGFIRVLWNVASVDYSITDYGGDDEDGDKYSGPVSGGGRRGHQLLQSRGQWQHSAAQGADTMWYLARQLRSQAGGHKIWAAVDKVLSNQRKCDRGHWAPPSTTSGQLTSSWSRYSYRLRLHPSTPPACIITPGQWGWQT